MSYDATTKGYDVFHNGNFVCFIPGQSKKSRIEAVNELIKSTHMGQWVKTEKGFEYCTTIGVYLRFEACKRLTATLGNYSL